MEQKKAEQYDSIADAYKESKQLSFRKFVEEYTLFKTLDTIEGHHVLDLACGEGFYTRKLKKAGAAKVIGVDISSEMIALAQKEETNNPIGCEYINQDAGQLDLPQQFDTITAMYLLNYAKTKEEILQFCQIVYKFLKAGGRFIGFNDNIKENPNKAPSFAKYGFEKSTPKIQKEGDVILYKMINKDNEEFEFMNFYLKPSTYEWAFKEAGFSSFEWVGPYLDPTQQGNAFWDDFMQYPPLIGFKALKTPF